MRSLVLIVIFLGLLPTAFMMPHIGALLWAWFAFMNPHREVFGFASSFQFLQIIAAVTFLAWLLSKEPKRLPMTATTMLMILFIIIMTFTTIVSLRPNVAWLYWEREIKVIVFGLIVAALINSKHRIHAMVWVMVISIGYFGVKGGAYTIATAGGGQVFGPINSPIRDNNHLAVGLAMMLPLMHYLQRQSRHRLIRLGLLGAMALTVVAILGTYSRGGFISLLIVMGYFWWQAKRKILIAIGAGLLVVPALQFMPQEYYDRIDTIQEADEDASFQGRLDAWRIAIDLARARPLTGGGFRASYNQAIANQYSPGHKSRATHSIYFEVLADHGFPGLVVFVTLITLGWFNCTAMVKGARNRPDLAWAADLGRMGQVSIAGYVVGGAALSLSYWTVVYGLLGILLTARLIVDRETARKPKPATDPPITPAMATLNR